MGDLANTMAAAAASVGDAKNSALKSAGLNYSAQGYGGPTFTPVGIPEIQGSGAVPMEALLGMAQGASVAGGAANNPMDMMQNPGAMAQDLPEPQGVNPNPAEDPKPYDNQYTEYDDTGPQGEPPIEVTGDSWKPESPGWLGEIIDTLKVYRGGSPDFKLRKNLPEALKGFQQDPERAIRRVAKIDPKLAWKMYEDYSRVQANAALQQKRKTDTIVEGTKSIGSMLGAIQEAPNPVAAYSKAYPTLNRYAKQMGYPDDMLPDQYDPDIIRTLRKGGLSVYQDETLKRMERQFGHTVKMDEMKFQDLSQHREQSRAETQRYHNEQLSVSRQEADRKGAVSRNIFYNDGSFGGVLSPDGRRAAIQGRDGEWYAYRLRKPGDINSRVRSPGEDKAVRSAYGAGEDDE